MYHVRLYYIGVSRVYNVYNVHIEVKHQDNSEMHIITSTWCFCIIYCLGIGIYIIHMPTCCNHVLTPLITDCTNVPKTTLVHPTVILEYDSLACSSKTVRRYRDQLHTGLWLHGKAPMLNWLPLPHYKKVNGDK